MLLTELIAADGVDDPAGWGTASETIQSSILVMRGDQ
jgi:hypothetical protein